VQRIVPVLILASTGWLLVILAAPIVASREPSRGWLFRAAALSYLGGAVVCHQRPERSFHVAGAQMPVCARCTGLYAAAPLGLLVIAWPFVGPMRPLSRPAVVRWLLLVALAPIGLSVGAEAAGLWIPSNIERFFTGLPAGFGVAWIVGAAARGYLR
jgi:uncharacterized membrane protein